MKLGSKKAVAEGSGIVEVLGTGSVDKKSSRVENIFKTSDGQSEKNLNKEKVLHAIVEYKKSKKYPPTKALVSKLTGLSERQCRDAFDNLINHKYLNRCSEITPKGYRYLKEIQPLDLQWEMSEKIKKPSKKIIIPQWNIPTIKQIYHCIIEYFDEYNNSPTHREIAARLSAQKSIISQQLAILKKQGLIEIKHKKSRGISLLSLVSTCDPQTQSGEILEKVTLAQVAHQAIILEEKALIFSERSSEQSFSQDEEQLIEIVRDRHLKPLNKL